MQNLSYENEFYWHKSKPQGETHFHINGFEQTHFDIKATQN